MAAGDLSLPAAIESPSDHFGWISAQIVAVPTPEELGIVTEREVMESSSDALFAYLNNTTQNVHVYVRLRTLPSDQSNREKESLKASSSDRGHFYRRCIVYPI